MDRVVIDNAQRLGAYLNVRLGSKCEELEPSISGLLLPSTADVRADVPVGRVSARLGHWPCFIQSPRRRRRGASAAISKAERLRPHEFDNKLELPRDRRCAPLIVSRRRPPSGTSPRSDGPKPRRMWMSWNARCSGVTGHERRSGLRSFDTANATTYETTATVAAGIHGTKLNSRPSSVAATLSFIANT